MNNQDRCSFWMDSKHQRYFLIPDNQKLSRGRFVISTLTGVQKKVTQTAIANFEISESAAKAYLENEIHQAMAHFKITVSNLMLSSTETSEKAPSTSNKTPSFSKILSLLLGAKVEDLQNNPEAAQINFVNIYTQFKECLGESILDNSTQIESARSHLHHLREILQAQGINISEEIEVIPNNLQEVLSSTNIEEFLQEIVIKLRDVTEEIEQSPGGFEQIIDETMKSLDKDSFSDEDKELEEKKKEEYKESAENAIAQSLKFSVFTPFAGGNFTS